MRYTDNELIEACKKEYCVKGVIVSLGRKYNSSSVRDIKEAIDRLCVDISHFDSSRQQRIRTTERNLSLKMSWQETLVKRTHGVRRKTTTLRWAMIESGIPYTCARCPVDHKWNGSEIRLEINHKDGDRLNDLPDNLEFICPNCHSQDEYSTHDPNI